MSQTITPEKTEAAPPVRATGAETLLKASSPGSRHSPVKHSPNEVAPRVRLEERDVALLCDLYTFGAMLRGQIQALFFPSLRRCNRRLRLLHTAGCVARSPLPLGPQTALHSGQTQGGQLVYRLGSTGVPIVAARLGRDAADVRRAARAGTPTHLAHTLEIVALRLALERATAGHPDLRLVRFLPERLVRHAYELRERGAAGGAWRTEVFKPDALAELAPVGGASRFFFVEVDLGHTSAHEFAAKIRIHRRYRDGGLFTRRYGAADFRTLVCTTGPARRDHLRRVAEAEGTDLFWMATFADIAQRGPLAAIWDVPFRDTPAALPG